MTCGCDENKKTADDIFAKYGGISPVQEIESEDVEFAQDESIPVLQVEVRNNLGQDVDVQVVRSRLSGRIHVTLNSPDRWNIVQSQDYEVFDIKDESI